MRDKRRDIREKEREKDKREREGPETGFLLNN